MILRYSDSSFLFSMIIDSFHSNSRTISSLPRVIPACFWFIGCTLFIEEGTTAINLFVWWEWVRSELLNRWHFVLILFDSSTNDQIIVEHFLMRVYVLLPSIIKMMLCDRKKTESARKRGRSKCTNSCPTVNDRE